MIKYFLAASLVPCVDLRLERKTVGASGYDLMANIGLSRILEPGRRWSVPTGLHLEMPVGVEGQIRTRSGLSRDHGIVVINAPGTVDSDYRGEVCATLVNMSDQPYSILPGDRIAQIVFCPVFAPTEAWGLNDPRWIGHPHDIQLVRVANLSDLNHTVRGSSGHGSTGR